MEYILDIYLSKNSDALVEFKSNAPFLPFARGDLINPFSWTNVEGDLGMVREKFGGRCILRVTDITHSLHNSGDNIVKHQLAVYTKAEKDD